MSVKRRDMLIRSPRAEILEMNKDSTHYTLFVYRFEGEMSLGCLGSVKGKACLIVNGLNRRAYLFHYPGYLHESYIYEKLCYPELSMKDAENIQLMLKEAGIHRE